MISIIYLKNKTTNMEEILGVYSCEVVAQHDYNLLKRAIDANSHVYEAIINYHVPNGNKKLIDFVVGRSHKPS